MNGLKKNILYSSFYQVFSILIPLITTPYVSRALGIEGIGRYSYAYSIAYYFVIFAMLGVNNYGNRTIARVRNDKKELSKAFCGIYTFQALTSLIVIGTYLVYISIFSDDKIISSIMLVYVVSAGIDINWLFYGLEKFKLIVFRSTLVKIFTITGVLLFVRKPADIYVYCIIYVLGMLLSQVIVWPFVFGMITFRRVSMQEIKRHIKPDLLLFMPVIAVSLYKFMDKIMLGYISSRAEVGYYESCEKIIQVPNLLVSALSTVMLPRISNLVSLHNDEKGMSYFNKSIAFSMFLSCSLSFGIMGVSEEFVPLFYGFGFEKCVLLFQILAPSCLFVALNNVMGTQYLIPHKKDKIYLFSVITGAAINLILNILLIPYMDSSGAAIATLMAEMMVCIVQCIHIKDKIDFIQQIKSLVLFFVPGLIMYFVLINIQLEIRNMIFHLIAKIIIGAFVYIVSMAFLRFLFVVFHISYGIR
jgi:Membrane protein involved in the export of O-antigen and teichoic acid